MKIIINETQKIETLSIIDPNTDVDYINDFVDGAIDYNDDQDAHTCDQETFNWWSIVVAASQELNYRLLNLRSEHGSDAVQDVINNAGACELEDYAANLNMALDQEFGGQA